MSLAKIQAIIDALRHERYRWTPVRRIYIEKKGTEEEAPAGVADVVGQAAAGSDPLCCWRRITSRSSPTAPTVSARAGVVTPRCGRSITNGTGRCGSSRVTSPTVSDLWTIRSCVSILAEKIHDGRFLRLIDGLLQAGYLEDWRYHAPSAVRRKAAWSQPVLSNIYLDRLDKYIETDSAPAYNQGDRRTPLSAVHAVDGAAWKREQRGDRAGARQLRRQMQTDALPRPPRSRTTGGCATPLRRRLAAGLHWAPTGGRGDQGRDRAVPAAMTSSWNCPRPRP